MKARIINAQTALLAAGMIALLTTLTAEAGAGSQQNPGVLPPDSSPFGASYSQWSERWWQWVFSLPVGQHPLFDTADVSAGQKGQVWFLGGNFTGRPETRNVTIPPGIALFFPVLNRWADNTDCSGGQIVSDGFSEASIREFIGGLQDQARNLSCTIDGTAVRGLSDPVLTPYRVQTPTPGGFSYSLPGTDNLLDFLGATCWTDSSGAPIQVDAAIYHPVGDGVYLMLAPLSVGTHRIHFHGEAGSFVEDILYNITVAGD